MPEPTIFGERLKKVRDLRGWTQEQLAEKAGLAASVVSHFETGVRGKPSADNLVKLSQALGVTVDYLLGRAPLPDVSDERVAVLLRSLSTAPAQKREDFFDMAKWLLKGSQTEEDEPTGENRPAKGE